MTIDSVEVEAKHFLWGVGILLASSWFVSRFLPGAAVRAGIRPRPLFDFQTTFPEPLGLVNIKTYLPNSVNSLLPGGAPVADQSQLGNAIVQATQQALSSTSESLSNITGGGGVM